MAVTGLVGLGALLALAPDAPQRLEELLFGDPLGVTDGDLVAGAALLTLGGAALAALHRPLAAAAFDPAGAAAAGARPGLTRLALLVLLAAAVAVAVQGLGALLVLAVLIGAAGRGPRPYPHAGSGDAGGCGRRRGRGRRGHRGLLPRPQRSRRVGGAGTLRRRRGGRRAQAVAGWGTSRRTTTMATPSASSAREMSCGWVRPATTSSLRLMNSTRKRSIPAKIR